MQTKDFTRIGLCAGREGFACKFFTRIGLCGGRRGFAHKQKILQE